MSANALVTVDSEFSHEQLANFLNRILIHSRAKMSMGEYAAQASGIRKIRRRKWVEGNGVAVDHCVSFVFGLRLLRALINNLHEHHATLHIKTHEVSSYLGLCSSRSHNGESLE